MAFRDLTDVLGTTRAKALPIRGAQVEFPGSISAWAGQMLLAIRRAAVEQMEAEGSNGTAAAMAVMTAGKVATEQDAEKLEAELFGDATAVLDDLGIFGEQRQHIATTLIAWHLSGQEAAELVWEGKAQAPNRAARRATAGRSSKTAGTARGSSRAAGGGSSVPRKRATGRGATG